MSITSLQEMWEVIDSELFRDIWVPLQDIYVLVETNLNLTKDDFLPAAPSTKDPKWRRNVRNVLQHRKTSGDIAWNKDGQYMIVSNDLEVSSDGVVQISKQGGKRKISDDEFQRILKSRRSIGVAGEEWVLDYERNHLISSGETLLSQKIQHISQTNVAAGYDVLSFAPSGEEKYIEVKTTALSKRTFYISENELKTSQRYQNAYWLYFITEIFGKPNLLPIQNPHAKVGNMLKLMPTNYRVEIKK